MRATASRVSKASPSTSPRKWGVAPISAQTDSFSVVRTRVAVAGPADLAAGEVEHVDVEAVLGEEREAEASDEVVRVSPGDGDGFFHAEDSTRPGVFGQLRRL